VIINLAPELIPKKATIPILKKKFKIFCGFGGHGADSKVLTEAKRDELYASILADSSMGWAVDVIDPRDLSAQMLCRFEKKMT
jgi:ribonuclease HII